MTVSIEEKDGTLRDGAIYRLVWRWHFYAALFVAPFAVLLAVTGALYLFQPQIEEALYSKLYNVTAVSSSISPDEQLKAVHEAYPESLKLAYMPPVSDTRSAVFRIRDNKGETLLVAVNPHIGVVLGAIEESKRMMQIVRNLHGKLLSGTVGQAIVELAASWLMVLLVTGLYLWWPRGRGVLGILIPRLKSGGRMVWRDLHAVTGVWLSFFLIFMVLTGLPWSLIAGKVIQNAEMHMGGVPQTGMGWDGGGSRFVKSETTHEGWATDHAMHMAGSAHSAKAVGNPLTLTQVTKLANAIPDLAKSYSIYFPVDAEGVYSVSSVSTSAPEATAYIHIDQYSGKVVSEIRWKDFGPMAKAIALGVSLHEGKYFGLPNQLLNLAVCLGLIGLVAAGLTTWWKRRPPGRLGAPKAPSNAKVGKGIIIVMVPLGLLMPLMGASIIMIAIAEWLVRKYQGYFPRIVKDV